MEFTKAELKELVGKRLTVNGERDVVAKVRLKDMIVITEGGVEIDPEIIYRRGRGFFADPDTKPAKSGKKAKAGRKAKAEKPKKAEKVSGRKQKRNAKQVEEEAVAPRRKRKAAKEEVKTTRGRNRRKSAKDEVIEVDAPKRKKAKPMEFKFDSAHVNKFVDLLSARIKELLPSVTEDLQLGSFGAEYNDDILAVTFGFVDAELSPEEVEETLSQSSVHARLAEKDELDDFADAEEEDDLEEPVKKRKSKKVEEVEEDEEDFDDEEDDDLDEVDDDFDDEEEDEDDEEEDSDDSEEEEDEDDEEDDDLDDEEDEDTAEDAIRDIVKQVVKQAPDVNQDKLFDYIRNYLYSEEIEEHFGDDMHPGKTRLDIGGGKIFILAGFDGENVRLLNPKNGKFRSATIGETARMEEAE